MKVETLIGEPWSDYALIDSGHGRKFERYGRYRFIRPEPQAMWHTALTDWDSDGEFVPGSDEDGGGRWAFAREVPKSGWPLAWEDVAFTAQTTPFRHLGFFPDMMPVWEWARGLKPASALNLFGYTGVGTLAIAGAGASVTHVDASKKSVEAAKGNAALSGMGDKPIRWLIDDAAKFTAREVRRGKRYDGIILDPPKYGRGPEGEVWQLERDLAPLLGNVRALVEFQPPHARWPEAPRPKNNERDREREHEQSCEGRCATEAGGQRSDHHAECGQSGRTEQKPQLQSV